MRLTLLALLAPTTLALGALAAPAEAVTPTCFGERATIQGTGVIRGTAGPDVIVAHGAAEVHALGGDDRVCGAFIAYGGAGNDQLRYAGSHGDGLLAGGGGRDFLAWRAGTSAELTGGDGVDTLIGASGFQTLLGGAGPDLLRGGGGADYLYGGSGPDVLHGGDGDDEVRGSYGDDRVYGGRGRDELSGDAGTDHVVGGPGADRCEGFESGTC